MSIRLALIFSDLAFQAKQEGRIGDAVANLELIQCCRDITLSHRREVSEIVDELLREYFSKPKSVN